MAAHDEIDAPIGDRVRSARAERGWSQPQLAKQSGVAQQTISRIETGATRDSRALFKIATAFGLPPGALDPDLAAEGVGFEEALARFDNAPTLPCYRTHLSSSSGCLDMPSDAVRHMARPPFVRDAPRAYAALLSGEHMAPEFRAGDVVYIDPDLPPRKGDPVLAVSSSGTKAMLRAFDGESETDWVLLYRALGARETAPKVAWPFVHAIVARLVRG